MDDPAFGITGQQRFYHRIRTAGEGLSRVNVLQRTISNQGRFDPETAGKEMHRLITELYPICRSITGNGVRETMAVLRRHIPLEVVEVPSGTKVFDWTVPKEWNIGRHVKPKGGRIIDFGNQSACA
jgi:aminopeptidase-like protein